LGGVPDGGLIRPAEHVVGAEDISDEDPVEASSFEQRRQVRPVGQVLIAPGLVVGMAPEAGRLVRDAVHVEGVEADALTHSDILRRSGSMRAVGGLGVQCGMMFAAFIRS
jgi:hypothetical protein